MSGGGGGGLVAAYGAPTDEGTEPNDTETQRDLATVTSWRPSGEIQCLHCGAAFTRSEPYRGNYCDDCRPPNGFRDT